MRKISLLGLLLVLTMLLILPVKSNAAQIGSGAFLVPIVSDYDGLGLPFNNTTPVIIDGNTYTTDNTNMRYNPFAGCTAECIGSDTDTGYIDIILGAPTLRAGGLVAISTGNVQFFDESDVLLGTVPVAGITFFAAWEADSGLIKRIRINDTEANGQIIAFENLTIEAQCTSDADCNDGQFCNGTETCDIPTGSCVAVSACPPAIFGCVTIGASCDELNDVCVDFPDDSQCLAGETCDINTGNCISAAPAVTDVPTMSQWGMVIFLFLAGLAAVFYLRRRRIE